jgi:cytochrome P450
MEPRHATDRYPRVPPASPASKPQMSVQETIALPRPPAPMPLVRPLGLVALLRVLARNPLEAWTQAHFEKPIVTGGLSIGRVAVVSDPEAIRHVLMTNSANYEKDWLQRRVLSAGLSNGLLTAEGHQWKVQRRALAPLFSRKTVTSFTEAMMQAAHALVERLRRCHGEQVDFSVEASRITLDVLERTIFSEGFGRDPGEIRRAMKVYFETIGRIDPLDVLGVPAFVPRPNLWKLKPTLRLFEGAVSFLIAARRKHLAEDPAGVPRDILTLLLEARDPDTGTSLSEVEIRANILTFIAAGQETTANCLTWSLYLLSQSPEWLHRVRAEADRELDGSIDGLAGRLVETRAVIDEANRLFPPITAISRQALGTDTLSGVAIKAGTMIVIAPYVLHRHRTLWDKPDHFDPARFLPGRAEAVHRFAYLPFGVGPRTCIGASFAIQEASIVLATIVRNFTLQLAPGHKIWPEQKVTLRPKGGLPMIVSNR